MINQDSKIMSSLFTNLNPKFGEERNVLTHFNNFFYGYLIGVSTYKTNLLMNLNFLGAKEL